MIGKKTLLKTISVASIICLMAFTLASCSGGESENSAADAEKTETEETQEVDPGLTYVDPSDLKLNSESSSGGSGPGGPNTSTYDYSGAMNSAESYTKGESELTDKEVTASEKDQNGILVSGGSTLTASGVTVKKSGSDNDGDNCNFYGLNSSILAVNEGTKAYVKDTSISSTSTGSNGIFATDSARVYAKSVKINTKGDNSRGLDATYGGVIYGDDLDITTADEHCAALATDRGGGYISVTNSKLSTAGSGSPLIYSTGDIEVDNVTGTASGSQIAGIEGNNRVIVYNSNLTSTNDAISGSDPIKNGIIIYQSMSGDADTSTSSGADFEAVNSTLKSEITDGAMFYVTNTSGKVVLENTKLDFDSSKVDLLNASGNSSNNWGNSGSNGGKIAFTLIGNEASGDVSCDSISSVSMYLLSGTEYTGKVKGKGADNVTVNVDSESTWVVTGNTTVKNLNAEDGAKIVDEDGKTVTIVQGGETKVKGDSDITVTVSGTYSNEVKDSSESAKATEVVDRADFDAKYESDTKFGTNVSEK